MCKMIYLINMCVWERKPASVLRTPASVFCVLALNFWWILNISGPNKMSKKRKKLVVQYVWVWRPQFLAHTVTFSFFGFQSIIFGHVIEGMEVVNKIHAAIQFNDYFGRRPLMNISVTNCGQLWTLKLTTLFMNLWPS